MNTSTAILSPAIVTDWRGPVTRAYLVILIAFGGIGGWAALAKIDSAAVAQGSVAARSNKKTIQHLEGGIVREILAHDGDQVHSGQMLMRLDDTQARASLETIRNQLAVARAQEARLIAERNLSDTIVFPKDVLDRQGDLMVQRATEDQIASFQQRSTHLRAQLDVLGSKIAQLEQEARGLANDAEANRQQLEQIDRELPGLRGLLAKQFVALTRVTTLERERFRVQGLIDRSLSDQAKSKQMIAETKFQIREAEQLFSQQVASDLIETRKNIGDLDEKQRVARDVLSRTEIRAPTTGIVQGSKFFTVGAVVRAGDPIMEIAPLDEVMVIRVQISPMDMDVVSEGLPAEIRFPTFHSHRVPIMLGRLSSISYDKVTDPQNPQNSYFQGEVVADPGSIPAEIQTALKAGMPAEVVITTGERTPLDYMLSPLFDRLRKGMRER